MKFHTWVKLLILKLNDTNNLLKYNDMIYAYYLQCRKVLCIIYYYIKCIQLKTYLLLT